MALGVALKLIEVGMRSHVSGVIALTPTTCHPDYVPEEFKESFVAYDENAVGVPMIDRDSMYTMYGEPSHLFHTMTVYSILMRLRSPTGYAGATELKDDPFIFPILHTRKAELPAVFIVTAGADPLRDDGTIFQQALDKAGCVTPFPSQD